MRTALPSSPPSRTMPLALAATGVLTVVAGVWVLRVFDPNLAGGFFPACLFLAFTGLYCPGCGITRALHALIHGDLGQMMAMNPLLPLLLVGLPVLVLQGLGYRLPLPAPILRTMQSPAIWLGVILVFWFARNLPWSPFVSLAPG